MGLSPLSWGFAGFGVYRVYGRRCLNEGAHCVRQELYMSLPTLALTLVLPHI